MVAMAIPEQDGFAQARAGGKKSPCSTKDRLASIQHAELFARKVTEAVARRTKIIHQNDGSHVQAFRQGIRVDHPGEIGGVNPVVNDRTRHTESRSQDFFIADVRSGLLGELLDNQLKSGEILAGKALTKHDLQFAVLL